MITIIALVLQVLMGLITPQQGDVVVIPPMPQSAPITDHIDAYEQGCMCEDCYWVECYYEAITDFTMLFDSYNYKISKNGRSMINGKFVKMGV